MSDHGNNNDDSQDQPELEQPKPQKGPDDTSNWDNRLFVDPSGSTYIKQAGDDK